MEPLKTILYTQIASDIIIRIFPNTAYSLINAHTKVSLQKQGQVRLLQFYNTASNPQVYHLDLKQSPVLNK